MTDAKKKDECQHYEHYVSREDRYICPRKTTDPQGARIKEQEDAEIQEDYGAANDRS